MIELDDRTKQVLHEVANTFAERNAVIESVDAPSLVYLVCDTEPGAFPELKIINLKGRKRNTATNIVSATSPLWDQCGPDLRRINELRKMVQPSVGKSDLSQLEFDTYSYLWKHTLRACLSSGKCYFGSLDSSALALGPNIDTVVFAWKQEDGQMIPSFHTTNGAPLLPWSFPYYLDRKAGRVGEVVHPLCFWFRALWIRSEAPPEAYEALAAFIETYIQAKGSDQLLSDARCSGTLQPFSRLTEVISDCQRFYQCPPIPELCYTLGVGAVKAIPQVDAWAKQPASTGQSGFSQISWAQVKKEGSSYQQTLAAILEKLLKHTTLKEIDRASAPDPLWFEFFDLLVVNTNCYWNTPDESRRLRMAPSLDGFTLWLEDGDNYTFTLVAGSQLAPCVEWFIPMYLNQRTHEIGSAYGREARASI